MMVSDADKTGRVGLYKKRKSDCSISFHDAYGSTWEYFSNSEAYIWEKHTYTMTINDDYVINPEDGSGCGNAVAYVYLYGNTGIEATVWYDDVKFRKVATAPDDTIEYETQEDAEQSWRLSHPGNPESPAYWENIIPDWYPVWQRHDVGILPLLPDNPWGIDFDDLSNELLQTQLRPFEIVFGFGQLNRGGIILSGDEYGIDDPVTEGQNIHRAPCYSIEQSFNDNMSMEDKRNFCENQTEFPNNNCEWIYEYDEDTQLPVDGECKEKYEEYIEIRWSLSPYEMISKVEIEFDEFVKLPDLTHNMSIEISEMLINKNHHISTENGSKLIIEPWIGASTTLTTEEPITNELFMKVPIYTRGDTFSVTNITIYRYEDVDNIPETIHDQLFVDVTQDVEQYQIIGWDTENGQPIYSEESYIIPGRPLYFGDSTFIINKYTGLGGTNIDENSHQNWLDGYYYPVLPKINKIGEFDYNRLGLQGGRKPFGSPGRQWNVDDWRAPITSDPLLEYWLNYCIIDLEFEEIEDDTIGDVGPQNNLGILTDDYKPTYTENPIDLDPSRPMIRTKIGRDEKGKAY